MKKKIIATLSVLLIIMTTTGGAVMNTASVHSEKKPVVAASQIPNRDETMTSRSTERVALAEDKIQQIKNRQEQPAKSKRAAVLKKTPIKKPIVKHKASTKRTTHSLPKRYSKGSSNSGNPRTYARNVLGATQFQCFSNIVERESGWNPYAQNPTSGAYGLVQALPGSKMASAGSDWRTNPITQIKWGIRYMNSRYGSPCGAWSFWQGHHYY